MGLKLVSKIFSNGSIKNHRAFHHFHWYPWLSFWWKLASLLDTIQFPQNWKPCSIITTQSKHIFPNKTPYFVELKTHIHQNPQQTLWWKPCCVNKWFWNLPHHHSLDLKMRIEFLWLTTIGNLGLEKFWSQNEIHFVKSTRNLTETAVKTHTHTFNLNLYHKTLNFETRS